MQLNKHSTPKYSRNKIYHEAFILSSKVNSHWIYTPRTFIDKETAITALQDYKNQHSYMSTIGTIVTTESSLTVLSVNHANRKSRTNSSVANLCYIINICTIIGAVIATVLLL